MRVFIDFWVFLCTLTGLIPSHTIRLFLYRTLFHVKIGKHTSIHWLARFNLPSGVEIGNNTIVGNDAFLDGRFYRKGAKNPIVYIKNFITPPHRPLRIGNNISIAGEVRIYTMQHDIDDPQFREVEGDVVIEDYVVIGTRVTVLPGVRIGKGAVIASGAVVTKNIDPYTVVGGVPAVFIRNRSKDLRYTLEFARLFQ
ncbi:hypothetical protein A2971_02775 [Candidatus Gottesmanbacteria bacterium RIFCSPLOWO2_01_FULL_46_21]|uniref:Acetyltransferase n=1 Tax=Candidatus Gottesmanbacteria bacterium RIFCSPLOWO2_01_FULL_46_21 TaxID=1798393 RepID=A0A1F6AV72_9BACT|nr:MAG: hypothetical protein A2971_02775 [Candidatus Gottesmanbacteria bacterium RIFCSPLOWO2_01_FULL_46_21]